ncbi:MAG TPA: TCR/Tet family MFS transporter [Steroidobacteraceae bacterium]|nr:TCR/Tet family MFS transporter [Steroidobacteraceae bacterium]
MSSSGTRAPGSAAFIFIFVTVALDMMAVGITAPVLPKLIIQFQQGDVARAAWFVGAFATLWAAMQFIFSPVIGVASDRLGRRPVILASNLGLGLDYVLMAVAPTMGWLFLGRLISGITSASYPTAGAYIADVTPPAERAGRFGMLGAAFGLGFIVGPAVGGVLGGIDLRLPFWVAAGLSLANTAYGFFILPESLPPDRRKPFSLRNAHVFGSFRLLRSHPELFGVASALFVMGLAHEALPNTFVLYADQRYGWSETQVGLALAVIGVSSVVVSMLLVKPLVHRLGERRVALFGLVCGIGGFLTFGLAPQGAIFLIGIALVALWGVANPSFQSLMSRRIDPSEQGQLQGALGSIRAVTGMLGPLLFTQVFAAAVTHGGEPLLGAPFLLSAVLLLVTLVVGSRVLPHRAPAQQ